ncbi:hypothetical protein BTS2_0508 [Bacillus sp. TS-2]|nr:hypothetical protein BTS2_0508 [Bacillus sp. TS-2]
MIKHGGCHDCGSKEQESLVSISNPITPMMGKAVCDSCKKKGMK